MEEMLVVGSKIKAYVKSKNLHMAGDFGEALSKEVVKLVDRAAERAKANRRSTIKGRDI